MPKSQIIEPQQERAKSEITFSPIPVNAYDRSLADELASGQLTRDDLL